MKSILFSLIAAAALFLALSALRTRPAKNAVANAAVTPASISAYNGSAYNGPRVPVVVELFTSEGCSSCPPADALLMQLDQTSPVPGAEIIALSEHVDYWNYIGWSDPFSSEAYSARQQGYAQALRLTGGRGDVYTPQMVVDGQFEFVGGNTAKAREVIAQAAAFPKAEVKVSLVNPERNDEVKLHVHASQLPQVHANDEAEVVLAVIENNLASSVTRGENSGRKLRHSAVTRELRPLGQFAAGQKNFETEATVKLATSWKRADVRLVAFIQEHLNRRILGAAAIRLN
ncbi:MAG: DUF1223 domain-containing protein [Acidobacteria bacterium]|nr:DUF1223 domain-containing protein [Acidobacteriota bacterium]MBI3422398.1 DUF1223 domain-containing protein [Acidobacteriota bacterium]